LRFLDDLREDLKTTWARVSTNVTYLTTRERGRKGKRTRIYYGEILEEELRAMQGAKPTGIKKISFRAESQEGMTILESSATRDGLVTLDYGTFSDFSRKIIPRLTAIADEWKEFFRAREREVKQGEVELHPYAIHYESDISSQQLKDLLRGLSSHYCYSVIHAGNPYFVGSFCDYSDGSSLGLTALGNRVTITPMSKATPPGLWEFTSRVQSAIGDGKVENISGQVPNM